jgi:hypothetical protein
MNSSFQLRDLPLASLSEADVRAEIIDPFLRELGYQTGSTNNILREGQLRYDFLYLGRKTKGDLKLSGRPDYVLEVGDFGTWLVEAKAGSVPLDQEAYEQAKSYALHPDVGAALFLLCNGSRFALYSTSSRSFEDALLRLSYEEIRDAWLTVESILSPQGFMRSVPRAHFDARLPLARGWPASLRLGAGVAVPSEVRGNADMIDLSALANMTNHIGGGSCERGPDGRIQTVLNFVASNAFTQNLLDRKGLNSQALETESEFISLDADDPTLFRNSFEFRTEADEELFDVTTWQPMKMPIPLAATAHITALAVLSDGFVRGTYSLQMSMKLPFEIPAFPSPLTVEQVGEFEIQII